MLTADIGNYTKFETEIADRIGSMLPIEDRLVGLLFMEKLQAKDISPSLNYFNIVSGSAIDFYLPGWSSEPFAEGGEPEWKFNPESFARSCSVISEQCYGTWRYSGGVDLLLLTARRTPYWTTEGTLTAKFYLDLEGMICLPVHEMVSEKLIPSASVLFHTIFDFAKSFKGEEPLLTLRLQETRVSLFRGFLETIIGYLLPKDAKRQADYAKYFVVNHDAGRRGSRAVMTVGRYESAWR